MTNYHNKSEVDFAVKELQTLYSKEVNAAGSHIFWLKSLHWTFEEVRTGYGTGIYVDANATQSPLSHIKCTATWNEGVSQTGKVIQTDNWFKILPTENQRHLEKYVYELLDGVCLYPFEDLSPNPNDEV